MAPTQKSIMITVEQADQIIFNHVLSMPDIQVPLSDAAGMVLRESLTADRDLPPFNRVTMDGIAIRSSSWKSGNRQYVIEGIQKAGSPVLTLKNNDACLEAMTGAILPEGCDCVIPIEQITITNGSACVNDDAQVQPMLNVHEQGSDFTSGAQLVNPGSLLLAPQIAVAASIGKAELRVAQSPKIAVVGNGDELVAIDQTPKNYQIRQSNSYALQAALHSHGYGRVGRFHIKDDPKELQERLGDMLKKFDVLVLSGGVSMGKFDYIPEVLQALGVEVLFHKVKQRPGKPFWFGRNKVGKPVFALPGNPVSTQVGLFRYVLPYLNRSVSMSLPADEYAVLGEDVDVGTELTCFLPVTLSGQPDGFLAASPVVPNSSGDFASLARSDGFIELPSGVSRFSKGVSCRLLRWSF